MKEKSIEATKAKFTWGIRSGKELEDLSPEEIVQIQVSRAKKAGSYRRMQAENPVWVCGLNFVPGRIGKKFFEILYFYVFFSTL